MAPDILGIQIVGILFGGFMLYYTFLNLKRHELTGKEYGAWTLLWAVFLLVAVVPQILEPIVKSLSLARTMDFFIILGFLFLFGTSFYTYLLVRKNQKRIEEIVRKVALEKGK